MIKPEIINRFFSVAMIVAIILLAFPLSSAWSNNQPDMFSLYDLDIDGLDGKKHRLGEWRGKVIVLNFWASWCGPCQYEIPRLKKWQHQHGSKGLQVLGIGLDDVKKLQNVARSLEIDYPLLVMPLKQGRPILADLGNKEMIIPFTLVINKDGTIAYRHKGLIGQDEFDIMIAPLL